MTIDMPTVKKKLKAATPWAITTVSVVVATGLAIKGQRSSINLPPSVINHMVQTGESITFGSKYGEVLVQFVKNAV